MSNSAANPSVPYPVNSMHTPRGNAMSANKIAATAEWNEAPISHPISAKRRRIVFAATIGNTLEWYDFLVYGLLAVTIAKLFFPTGSELSSLLLSMATLGVGLAMRPVGAIVLGIYADRVGRRAALSWAIVIMALGTGLIAVAPTYETIGIFAPLFIVLARLLQGFSCGGEMGGAIAFLAENAPERQRGLYASWQAASQSAGFLLAAIVTMVMTLSMTPAQIESGGWRLPFVLGLLIAPVGFYIRSKLDEPELFLKARSEARPAAVADTLRDGQPALIALGLSVLYLVSAYLLLVYMPTFALRQLQLPFAAALQATVVASCLVVVCAPIAGAISDRIGRKPMLQLATLGYLLLTYPAFVMISAWPSLALLTAVQSGFAVLMSIYCGPLISVLAELFPTRLRSTGVALIYNLVAVAAGFAPAIVTWLIAVTGDPRAPAFYVIGAAVISGTALFWLRDRHTEPLRQ
jgi:MHS family proline/betaine transporter-like MFS transporter